ncbi:MAG: tripartite tricarboxylate transporter permease [Defluviitaleaceae bacterium]|nr:tripartite tricarboxylate transporter permease [Defluviitaleaceae bacterium]
MDVIVESLGYLFTLENLIFVNFGTFMGIIVGAIPGISGALGIAVFLPFTFTLSPVAALLMLCGIFFGANFGGSISSILINTPGTNGAVAALLDGYPLTKKGFPLKALSLALVASVVGGTISSLSLLLFAPQIGRFALRIGAPEYFALALFGLSIIASVSGKSLLKGLVSGALGMLLATVGIDGISGMTRFTFGNIQMFNGIRLVAVLLGVYAIASLIGRVNGTEQVGQASVLKGGSADDRLTRQEIISVAPIMAKSSAIGALIGAIPGPGSAVASFIAYNEAKRTAKPGEKFGEGELKGLAAPESANSGATASNLIPLLTLGIPGDAVTAVLVGAFTMHGIVVGPRLFETDGALVYAMMIGFVLSQVFIYLQGRYLMPVFVRITHVPQDLLTAMLMIVCSAGAFAIANNVFELRVMLIFGVVAYVIAKLGFPAVPIVLGMVLGPIAESNLRNALTLSNGSWAIFVQRPISLAVIVLTFVLLYMIKKNSKKISG